jgi:hypothetical protein
MKDQYVGDINDYAKYLLLRMALPRFDPVVVAWMLTGGDRRGDGGRIRYLSKPHWRNEDPELYDALGPLVAGNRSVAAVEQAGFLRGCLFASQAIDEGAEQRRRYFTALEELASPDALIFFDPDNGLEVPSVPRHRQGSHRYLFWEELVPFRKAGASVLIYQHFPRVDRKTYLDRLLRLLAEEMGGAYLVFAAHSSQVGFLFALRQQKSERLWREVEQHCAQSQLISFYALS